MTRAAARRVRIGAPLLTFAASSPLLSPTSSGTVTRDTVAPLATSQYAITADASMAASAPAPGATALATSADPVVVTQAAPAYAPATSTAPVTQPAAESPTAQWSRVSAPSQDTYTDLSEGSAPASFGGDDEGGGGAFSFEPAPRMTRDAAPSRRRDAQEGGSSDSMKFALVGGGVLLGVGLLVVIVKAVTS